VSKWQGEQHHFVSIISFLPVVVPIEVGRGFDERWGTSPTEVGHGFDRRWGTASTPVGHPMMSAPCQTDQSISDAGGSAMVPAACGWFTVCSQRFSISSILCRT
jgi:hypothetical protein